jgi:hypothetical protein
VPAVHAAVALVPTAQRLLQAPQFATSLASSASQPSTPRLLQSPKPMAHRSIAH